MKNFLLMLFSSILAGMAAVTVWASLRIGLFEAWPDYSANPWAIATLFDAYFGFITFYVWVFYKETRWWSRALWFVLIMGLGNMAMSVYVLIQLLRLGPGEPVRSILLRKSLERNPPLCDAGAER